MTSHPEWDTKTSALAVAEVFADRIKGKNVLITGVSPNGVGEGTAKAFALGSPKTLILASRTRSKLEAVAADIRAAHQDIDVRTVTLDLLSQESVRSVAAQVGSLVDKLDILVNNAGVSLSTRVWTPEGIEGQFGANHIGPFLLTNLLLPLLEKAAKESTPGETRVVNLASGAHRITPIRFSDYNIEDKPVPPEEQYRKGLPEVYLRKTEDGYLGIVAYGQSKTANILFTAYLQKFLPAKGIAAYCLHPGGVRTQLGRDQDKDVSAAIEKTASYWKNVDQGAATTMVAALDPALNEQVGLYLDDCQFAEPVPHATDPVAAERLWHLSEKLVGRECKL